MSYQYKPVRPTRTPSKKLKRIIFIVSSIPSSKTKVKIDKCEEKVAWFGFYILCFGWSDQTRVWRTQRPYSSSMIQDRKCPTPFTRIALRKTGGSEFSENIMSFSCGKIVSLRLLSPATTGVVVRNLFMHVLATAVIWITAQSRISSRTFVSKQKYETFFQT